MTAKDFILASSSPQRIKLLEQIGFTPKAIYPADIDESELKYERPSSYVKRMAREKALKVYSMHKGENVLACDTIVVVGRRMLHKAKTDEEQTAVMKLLSGHSHKVLSAVCMVSKTGKISEKLVSTRILMKKLSYFTLPAKIGHFTSYQVRRCLHREDFGFGWRL